MAFEEEFGCEIPDDAAEKIVTLKDAVAYLSANSNQLKKVTIEASSSYWTWNY